MRIRNKIEKLSKNKYFEISLIFIYKLLLDFIFFVLMNNGEFDVYKSDFVFYKWIISIIVVLLCSFGTFKIKDNFSRFYIKLINLVMIVPISTIFVGKDYNLLWYLMIIIEFIVILLSNVLFTNYIRGKRWDKYKLIDKISIFLNKENLSKAIYYIFVINTFLILILCIYYNGLPSLIALNLKKVYYVRDAFYLPKYIGYLYNFQVKFISLFLMALYLDKKCYRRFILITLIQLFFFLIKGDKVTLLSIPLTIGVYYLFNNKRFNSDLIMLKSFVCVSVLSIITKFLNFRVFIAIFTTRLLFTPANLKFIYFDFFSKNPNIGIVGTFLNFILKIPNPYAAMPYQNVIAHEYFSNPNVYYNTGVLAEGFARFSYVGVILIPLILGILIAIISSKSKRNGMAFSYAISIFPLFLLNDVFMLHSLLFGELLLLLIVVFGFKKDYLKLNVKYNSDEKNVVMLLDNAFAPDVRVYKEAKYLMSIGKNVTILCLDRKNEYVNEPTKNVDGINIVRFTSRTNKVTLFLDKNKFTKKLKKIVYFYWLIKFMFKCKKYTRKMNYIYLHCHDLVMASMACIFFPSKTRIFDMHELYGNKKSKVLNFFIQSVMHFTQNSSSWIIYVNDFQKRNCREFNYDKLIYLPNYPEISKYIINKNKKKKKISVNYIGTVRDFNSLKMLIDYNDKNKKFEFGIYGSGSELNNLLEYAKKKKKERIIKGKYDGINDSGKIYANTNLLYAVYDINSRLGENWRTAIPVKGYEAIVSQTPPIATKGSEFGRLVEKYDIGFLIDINDEQALSKLFNTISNNPDIIEKKRSNIEKIRNEFSWDEISKNLDTIYGVKE